MHTWRAPIYSIEQYQYVQARQTIRTDNTTVRTRDILAGYGTAARSTTKLTHRSKMKRTGYWRARRTCLVYPSNSMYATGSRDVGFVEGRESSPEAYAPATMASAAITPASPSYHVDKEMLVNLRPERQSARRLQKGIPPKAVACSAAG